MSSTEEENDNKGCITTVFFVVFILSAILITSFAMVLNCSRQVGIDGSWSELLKVAVPCLIVLIILGYFAFIHNGKKVTDKTDDDNEEVDE